MAGVSSSVLCLNVGCDAIEGMGGGVQWRCSGVWASVLEFVCAASVFGWLATSCLDLVLGLLRDVVLLIRRLDSTMGRTGCGTAIGMPLKMQ